MSEDWTVKPVRLTSDATHTTTFEGLEVEVEESAGGTRWTVRGYLGEDAVLMGGFTNVYQRPVEQAQAEALAAARRLHAVGGRGEKVVAPLHEATVAREDAARETGASEEGA